MEDKKTVKISLGTVVCIFIIILLIVALGIVYYLGFVKNDENNKAQKAELESKINELENKISVLEANNSKQSPQKENEQSNDNNQPYFNKLENLPDKCDETVLEKIVIPGGFDGFNGGAGEIYKSDDKKIMVSGEIGPNNYEWTVLYNDNVIIKYSGDSNSDFDGAPNDYIIYVLKDYIVLVTENENGLIFGFQIFDLKGNEVYSKSDDVIKIYYKNGTDVNNAKDPIIIYKNQIYFVVQKSKDGLYYIDLSKTNLKEVKISDL